MRKLKILPLVLLLSTLVFAADVFAQRGRGRHRNQNSQGIQQGSQNAGQGRGTMAATGNRQNSPTVLSDKARQGLILMREEEKLARDVYLALNEKWGERVFANISQAESRHMNALANLLSRYGIPDPIKDDTPGKFTAVPFQQLYQELVTTGSNSLADAFKVGLTIEELDIADLRTARQTTANQDIIGVYDNLERGSRNHLRAFASSLKLESGTYTASHLSQEEFDTIASSDQERGGGGGKGRAGGQGRGRAGGQGRGQGRGRAGGQGRGQGRGHGGGQGRG